MSLCETDRSARRLLSQEAEGMLSRLAGCEPLALIETSVPAAAIDGATLWILDRHLAQRRRDLAGRIQAFAGWLSASGRDAPLPEAQRRLSTLRMQFILGLDDYDLFSDALTQRSESRHGVRLAGLDAVARDALHLRRAPYADPPVLCYLDRGRGAAIRRLRTRLPGGGTNPVALIRLPRERMVGTAVAGSLVHEVGHQGAALLGLVPSLLPVLHAKEAEGGSRAPAWALFGRWVSEIVADLWSVARVGLGATLGLMSVLSLPRRFAFRITTDDPHPTPWLRVLISAELGSQLYPDPQWQALDRMWRALYPPSELPEVVAETLHTLDRTLPELATLLLRHQPATLGGASLAEALADPDRSPQALTATFLQAGGSARRLAKEPPSRAIAAVAQASALGLIDARREAALLDRMLTTWALENTRTRITARTRAQAA
jgi:hypothetical protein